MSKMKMSTLSSSQLHLLKCTTTNLATSSNPSFLSPISSSLHPKHLSRKCNISNGIGKPFITHDRQLMSRPKCLGKPSEESCVSSDVQTSSSSWSRFLIVGAVSVGVAMLVMGIDDDQQKAMALGPEGPLMEEFWDNVRRYALYALTVSTGALYTVFQPLYELLKNPISAILVLIILGGGFFIMTQVVSAMIGVTDFDYQYQY